MKSDSIHRNVYGIRHPVKIIMVPRYGARRIPADKISLHSSFTSFIKIWNYLPPQIRQTWKPPSKTGVFSDYSMFIDENISRFEKGQLFQLTTGTGFAIPDSLTAFPASQGEIAILFEKQSPVFMTVFTQQIHDGIGSTDIECWNDIESDSGMFIDGLTIGKEYLVYCIMSDKPLASDCIFSASRGFRISI